MINLATVGTSNITRNFLSGCELTKRYNFIIAYSRSEKIGENFRISQGFEKSSSNIYEVVGSPNINAVYIASPNSCHYSQSKLFLENGKNVICEKPITTSTEEYVELKNLADSKGLVYMEAIIPRHTAQYGTVKQALSEIGEIKSARFDFSQCSSRLDSFLKGEHSNIFDMSLKAGCLMDIGVYCVYAAIDLLGVPQSIKADASYLYNGADGSGSAIFNYGDYIASLTYNKTCNGTIGSEIIGIKGTLKIEKISQYAGVTLIKDGMETRIAEYPTKAELMSGEADSFANYIENFSQYNSDYESISKLALNVHKTMDLIKQSAGIKYPD